MMRQAQAVIQDLLDTEQISHSDHVAMTAEVAKSLSALDGEAFNVEVVKGMEYGAVTTDHAQLTQGGALMGAGWSDYRKRKKAEELYEATKAGYSPVCKAVGYTPSEDGVLLDVADVFMQEHGASDDDALECAELFVKLLSERGL